MKAADIPDEVIYRLVDDRWKRMGLPGSLYDIAEALRDQFAFKIIRAKCSQMIRKGRLSGCPCGCRGDFRLPHEVRLFNAILQRSGRRLMFPLDKRRESGLL